MLPKTWPECRKYFRSTYVFNPLEEGQTQFRRKLTSEIWESTTGTHVRDLALPVAASCNKHPASSISVPIPRTLRHSQLAPCSFQYTSSTPPGFSTEIQSD